MDRKTQRYKILKYLQRGFPLTQEQALNWWKVKRLASRICELRQAGYDIVTRIDERDRCARYSLLAKS